MARGRRPTRRQKEIMKKHSHNSNNWYVLKNPPGEIHLIHRTTGTKSIIKLS